jgi:hypothetical protein
VTLMKGLILTAATAIAVFGAKFSALGFSGGGW